MGAGSRIVVIPETGSRFFLPSMSKDGPLHVEYDVERLSFHFMVRVDYLASSETPEDTKRKWDDWIKKQGDKKPSEALYAVAYAMEKLEKGAI